MRYLRFGSLTFLPALFALSGTLQAQVVASGPTAGSDVAALKVIVATGDAAGKDVDYAAERKSKPTLFIFVQADKWDRPVARFIRAIDQELAKSHTDVLIVAIWLTDDVEQAKAYLPKAQQSLRFAQTIFTVYAGDKGGPAAWGMNADAHLTVVVAEEQKVTASLGFKSVNETDAPAVLKKLKPTK